MDTGMGIKNLNPDGNEMRIETINGDRDEEFKIQPICHP